MKKTLMMLWMAVSLMVSLVGCSSEEMDYENPDVTVFVKQLKAGTYNMKNEKGVVEVPHFTEEDIPELLKYAEDLTIIPSFPSVYNTNNGKIRLGECMLWVIESIRQGTAPSLGCRMVLANAENYEAIYFLTDDEVLDAAACYRHGGKGGNIRRRPGRLIRAMTSRFVAQDTDGGKKRKILRGIKTKKHEATFICISSLCTADRGVLCPMDEGRFSAIEEITEGGRRAEAE